MLGTTLCLIHFCESCGPSVLLLTQPVKAGEMATAEVNEADKKKCPCNIPLKSMFSSSTTRSYTTCSGQDMTAHLQLLAKGPDPVEAAAAEADRKDLQEICMRALTLENVPRVFFTLRGYGVLSHKVTLRLVGTRGWQRAFGFCLISSPNDAVSAADEFRHFVIEATDYLMDLSKRAGDERLARGRLSSQPRIPLHAVLDQPAEELYPHLADMFAATLSRFQFRLVLSLPRPQPLRNLVVEAALPIAAITKALRRDNFRVVTTHLLCRGQVVAFADMKDAATPLMVRQFIQFLTLLLPPACVALKLDSPVYIDSCHNNLLSLTEDPGTRFAEENPHSIPVKIYGADWSVARFSLSLPPRSMTTLDLVAQYEGILYPRELSVVEDEIEGFCSIGGASSLPPPETGDQIAGRLRLALHEELADTRRAYIKWLNRKNHDMDSSATTLADDEAVMRRFLHRALSRTFKSGVTTWVMHGRSLPQPNPTPPLPTYGSFTGGFMQSLKNTMTMRL